MMHDTIHAGEVRVGDRLHGADVYEVRPLRHDPGRVVVSAGRNGIGFAIVLGRDTAVPVQRRSQAA